MLANIVKEQGGRPRISHSISQAIEEVEHHRFDLIILDNQLPDGRGQTVFQHLRSKDRLPIVVVLTGVPELAQAVEMTRQGLFDYLTKPVDEDALLECIQRAKLRMTRPELDTFSGKFISRTPAMNQVNKLIQQAAVHPAATVLLLGETGVGKDLAARLLHGLTYSDGKGARPFVSVNCAALPADIFEGELFGSEKGAYTGADKKRVGLVRAADGGTLFLDEISEVPLPLQAKLLQLLETREYRPLGSTETQAFNGRFIAATNKDLQEEVRERRFREDLLYRINVFTVFIPPLRQRKAEIVSLAELLLRQISEKYQRDKPLIRPDDLPALLDYDYPGNVRELRNLMERSLLKTPLDDKWLALDLAWLKTSLPENGLPASADDQPEPPQQRDLNPLEQQEYEMIRKVLIEENGGIRRAAGKLGISHQALLRRLQKWPELRHPGKAQN